MNEAGGRTPAESAYWELDDETGEVIDYDYPHD